MMLSAALSTGRLCFGNSIHWPDAAGTTVNRIRPTPCALGVAAIFVVAALPADAELTEEQLGHWSDHPGAHAQQC
jgi:hypothetical protein